MTCPNCGYCPHCGRSNWAWPYHPWRPWLGPYHSPSYGGYGYGTWAATYMNQGSDSQSGLSDSQTVRV